MKPGWSVHANHERLPDAHPSIEKESSFALFGNWLRNTMPEVNNKILWRLEQPEMLIPPTQEFVNSLPRPSDLDDYTRMLTIQYLGFAISSIERHMQDRSKKPGEGLASIKGAEPLLIQLGTMLGHPPRDSLYTFAYWNRSPNSITFTGNYQEALFIDVVNGSSDNLETVGDLLRPIARGEISFHEPQIAVVFDNAQEYIEAARQHLFRYLQKTPNNEFVYSVPFFRDVMRQYNCDWFIDGQNWGPPTAANAVAQMQIDFLLGTLQQGYREHILERYRYFTHDDQVALSDDMNSPNILDQVRSALVMSEEQIMRAPQESLAESLSELPADTRNNIKSAVDFVKKLGTLSALHWTLINTYLIKPNDKERHVEAQKHGAVDNTKGASGMEFNEVKSIRDMRRLHPEIEKLSQAINLHS